MMAKAPMLAMMLAGRAHAQGGDFAGGGHLCDCIPLKIMGVCADPSMACGEFTACIDSKFTKPDGSALPYPTDYGSSCQVHKEPGEGACYDLETGEELPEHEQKGWCKKPWCFVNPCTCNDPRAKFTITDSAACCKTGTGGDVTTAFTYANCVSSTDTWNGSTKHSQFAPGDRALWESSYGTCPSLTPSSEHTCQADDEDGRLRLFQASKVIGSWRTSPPIFAASMVAMIAVLVASAVWLRRGKVQTEEHDEELLMANE